MLWLQFAAPLLAPLLHGRVGFADEIACLMVPIIFVFVSLWMLTRRQDEEDPADQASDAALQGETPQEAGDSTPR